MKDRVAKIIKEEQLSPAKFADILGVQRSSISHYLSGRNNPSLDFIQRILLKFKYISSDWLLTGKGEMYKHLTSSALILNKEPEKPQTDQNISSPESNNSGFIFTEDEEMKHKEGITTDLTIKSIDNKSNINKIIIYFSDNTFQEFFPGK